MRLALSHVLKAGVLAILLSPAFPVQQASKPSQAKPAAATVMTGCLDQTDDEFVLRDDRDLHQIAVLEPVDFPKDNLAKFVGQRVKVRGAKEVRGRRTTLKVRNIEVLSQTCAP